MHICHFFDRSAGWEQRVGLCQLLDRLPADQYENHLAAIHGSPRTSLGFLDRAIDVLPHLADSAAFSGPAVSRFVAKRKIDLIHAWGVEAAAAAQSVSDTPLLLQIYDPLVATCEVRRLRALAHRRWGGCLPAGFAVACNCEVVRRRLVEGGFPQDLTVVIRPAVDFSVINTARGGSLREDLALTWNDHVVIVPEPVSRAAGSLKAVYAVCLRNHLSGGLRVIVPGHSPERRRIERFVARLPVSSPLVTISSHIPFEQLVSISDTMLITPLRDISTTSIAWAMAAGVTVIGTATYAVSEMIANKVNGLLFKHGPDRAMAASLSKFLQDRTRYEEVRQTARSQAYEVFGLRRYVEQTVQLYDNLLSSRSADHGISDSAIDV